MDIRPFTLERYFATYEFSARHLLSSSDCDGLAMAELLSWADDELTAIWEQLHLGYTESAGHPLLRAEIARLYRDVAPDEVIELVPEEAVFAAVNCLVGPGDHVVCTYPGYQSLYEVAVALGATVEHWKPHEKHGWRFDPDDLATLIGPQTKLVVVNFPHNPTGWLPPAADFRRVVEICEETGAHLFCDEMYRYLEQDPADRLPSAPEIYDRAVALFGMSKTYGLAGLRVGWLVTHDAHLRARLQAFKDYLTICGSAPSEILATVALRNRERIVTRHVERIRRNLDEVERLVEAHRDVLSWVRPRAGSVCFPRLDGPLGAAGLARRLIEERDVMAAPAGVFGYGDRHIRIGLGRETLPQVLEIVDDLLATDG